MGEQFNPSGSYKTISNYPPQPSAKAIKNREPLDVWLLNSGSIMLSCSDGSTEIELKTLSGTVFYSTSTFTGKDWYTAFPSTDMQLWSQLSITAINNHATYMLQSASIDWSPDGTNFETDWDEETFSGLGVGKSRSIQISGNSRRYLRVRAIPSGTVEAGYTGSLAIYVHTNNG